MGGRKTNSPSNLFSLIANVETGTMLHSGLHSLYTANNSTPILSFSQEHVSTLHKPQKTIWLESQLFLSFLGLGQENKIF